MESTPSLTEKERQILTDYIAHTERFARNFRTTRVAIAISAIIGSLLAIACLSEFWVATSTPYQNRASNIEMPADAPPGAWAVAEFNRTSALLHSHNQLQMFSMLLGVCGLILGTFAIVLFVMLRNHWRDGERMAVIAKIAKWQLEHWNAT